ncbi:MAG: hypothetical protein CMF52_06620 [Legionellales bacterium]|nr:hypothetical protein [Legionellales bacterium]|tara:strand:+ start:11643 stop:13349 length:1707 start_codon:yes stop_codon:yes gene_type:complete
MSWHEEFLSKNVKKNKAISEMKDLFQLFEEVYESLSPSILGTSSSQNSLEEDDYKILDEMILSGISNLITESSIQEKVTKKQRKEAEKFILSLPSFVPTEAWGDPTTADRKTINRIFAVMGGGRSVQKKLEFLQRITSPTSKIESPRRVIASLLILEALSALIYSFNEASAGFVFEGWLAALLQGRQEAERSDKGNLPIQDLIAFSELKDDSGQVPVSLKLLSPDTHVEGSFTNLIDALFDDYADKGGAVNYVVARKNSSAKKGGKVTVDSISIESFDINQRNFIDLFTLTSGKIIDKKTREKSAKQKKHGLSQFTFKSEFRDRILASFPELVGRVERGFTTGKDLKVLDSSDDIAILKAHLDDPTMLYTLLQHCAGYTGKIRNPLFQDQEDPEQEQPATDSSSPQEDDNQVSDATTPAKKKRGMDYDAMFAELGDLMPPKKGQVSERQKSEGATGWTISTKQVEFLSSRGVIELQQLGTLPASREQIIDVAVMHMDTVREKFQVLFKAFSELTEDINKYVTFPSRGAAMNAGQRAIGHTETIQDQMKENITADTSAPDSDFISSDEI